MLSRAFSEFYRCPEGILDFALTGALSQNAGYFRFGSDAICYGRSCSGDTKESPESPLCDVMGDTAVSDETLELPFDLTEIIDNLRLERYPHRLLGGREGVLKRIYYLVRPLTSRRIRSRVQRFHARRSQGLAFPNWPVDTTVESLFETILLLVLQEKVIDRLPFVWFWPHGDRGCVVMTHDVETEVGRNHCPYLLDLDEFFAIKSSFEFVPEERYQVPAKLLEEIRNRGCEIVIQDLNHDGRLFDNKKEFLRRAVRIRHYAKEYGAQGFRSAVLYRKPEWYDALEFSFDMSIPNVAHLDPQLGGCCTVMPYFIGNTLELPVTTIQDYSLFHVLNERSIDLWDTQVKQILGKNGMASFIVHPDYIMDSDTRRVYTDLLSYLQRLRQTTPVWFALPREVCAWWNARSRMSIVKNGDSWQIHGEGAENAVLAFARSVNGQLRYQLEDETVKV
jgi:hypothetical protein